MSAFDQAFAIVIGHEGGYSNDPRDPGGETKFGISKRSYPNVDIVALTLDGAKAIYKRDYWDRLELDTVDPGLALVVFDAAVNAGVGAATKWLQAAVGVTADGIIGPVTRAAIARADPLQVLVEVHAQRIQHHASLSTWGTFKGGWSRRLAHLPFQAARMEG